MNSQAQYDAVARSAVVLANAGELTAGIISNIAGNDISNSINGSRITSSIIQSLLMQRIHKNLEQKARA
jgi:hypothetical protein